MQRECERWPWGSLRQAPGEQLFTSGLSPVWASGLQCSTPGLVWELPHWSGMLAAALGCGHSAPSATQWAMVAEARAGPGEHGGFQWEDGIRRKHGTIWPSDGADLHGEAQQLLHIPSSHRCLPCLQQRGGQPAPALPTLDALSGTLHPDTYWVGARTAGGLGSWDTVKIH